MSPGKQLNVKYPGFETDASTFADYEPRDRLLVNYKWTLFQLLTMPLFYSSFEVSRSFKNFFLTAGEESIRGNRKSEYNVRRRVFGKPPRYGIY